MNKEIDTSSGNILRLSNREYWINESFETVNSDIYFRKIKDYGLPFLTSNHMGNGILFYDGTPSHSARKLKKALKILICSKLYVFKKFKSHWNI